MINLKENEILKLVKLRLGISSDVRDEFLIHLIDSSLSETMEKGIDIDLNINSHKSYIVDLSCFKYKNNDFKELPRYLRYRLNNLMLGASR